MEKELEIRDEGDVTVFLGVRVRRLDDGSYALDQKHYIEEMAKRFDVTDTMRKVKTPGRQTMRLSREDLPKTKEEKMKAKELDYQGLVGSLLYATKTRPDVAYTVNDLARFMSEWGRQHYAAAHRALIHLYQTRDKALIIGRDSSSSTLCLECYADASYGDEREMVGGDDRWKSQSGYLLFVNGSCVSWQSRRQKTRVLSSMEAEYVAASEAAKEVLWARQLLEELGHAQQKPTIMHEDNSACESFSKNSTCHDRSKHISIKEHWLKDTVKNGGIEVVHVESAQQLADMLTKHQAVSLFQCHQDVVLNGLNSFSDYSDRSKDKSKAVHMCVCSSCVWQELLADEQ